MGCCRYAIHSHPHDKTKSQIKEGLFGDNSVSLSTIRRYGSKTKYFTYLPAVNKTYGFKPTGPKSVRHIDTNGLMRF